jgi:hypothetical protein
MRTVLIVAVLVAILLMYLSARRRRTQLSERAAHPQLTAWQEAGSVSPILREQIVTIAAHRGSSAAVDHVRDISGLPAADSQQLVDAVLAGRRGAPGAGTPQARIDLTQAQRGSLAEQVRTERDRSGRTSAIQLVRRQTGMSADDAARFVDALE